MQRTWPPQFGELFARDPLGRNPLRKPNSVTLDEHGSFHPVEDAVPTSGFRQPNFALLGDVDVPVVSGPNESNRIRAYLLQRGNFGNPILAKSDVKDFSAFISRVGLVAVGDKQKKVRWQNPAATAQFIQYRKPRAVP